MPTYALLGGGYEQKVQGGVVDMANKNAVLRRSWALPNNLKHNGARFLTILTDSLCVRVAQMPRYRDLIILSDGQNRLLYPLLCMCTQDNS